MFYYPEYFKKYGPFRIQKPLKKIVKLKHIVKTMSKVEFPLNGLAEFTVQDGVKERETNDVNEVNGLKILLGSHAQLVVGIQVVKIQVNEERERQTTGVREAEHELREADHSQ